jgi:beta-glucanase (GH16 family)
MGIGNKPSTTARQAQVLGVLVLALCLQAGCTQTSEVASPIPILFDNFAGSRLGPAWTALNREGDQGVGEQECYNPSQVSVSNSLIITTIQLTTICGDSENSPAPFPYLSGMVQWTSFNFTYGTVEFRAKMAGGQGTWSAVWMLGANCQATSIVSAENTGCNWPQPGSQEIDIAEIKNSISTTVWQNLIAGNNQSCTPTASDVAQNFHVYELVWEPDSLLWKIDGTQTCMFTTNIPSTPMFLLINTAVGGAGGTPDPAAFPQTMSIDYVKITQPK